MPPRLIVQKLNREELPGLLGSPAYSLYDDSSVSSLSNATLGPQEILVGFWGGSPTPLPDFMIVRDDAFEDWLAWLSAFLPTFSPMSQWCRLWKLQEFSRLLVIPDEVGLDGRLGAWVGAILAEFSAENGNPNLKEISAAAVLTSSSYSAARATSVWQSFNAYDDILARHNAMFGKRQGALAESLFPIWYVLAGERWHAAPVTDVRPLAVFRQLMDDVAGIDTLTPDDVARIASTVSGYFDVQEIAQCAVGPQSQRLEALDRLASILASGPKSASISAIIGFGASLVDPGAAVLPDLLGRYSARFPVSVIWSGAFAGMFYPARVLSDHAGLGRIVAKQLASPHDLFTKPSSDVSYEEFRRWTGGQFSNRASLRGFMARSLFVEIWPGVTVPFSGSRQENSRSESQLSSPPMKQTSLKLDQGGQRPSNRVDQERVDRPDDLLTRLDKLERQVNDLLSKSTKGRSNRSSK